MKRIFLILFGPAFIILAFFWLLSPNAAQAAQAHPGGTLVSIGSTIWRLSDDGKSRQAIDSAEKFFSHRFSFARVVPANAADLTLADKGLLPWGDGVLFSDDNIIYQVSGGQKHGFISATVYLEQGFNFTHVRPGNLDALKEGTSVRSGQEKHLPGTILKDSNGTFWLQGNAGAQPFPSAAVFSSYGGNFAEAVNRNANDNLLPTQLLQFRPGTLVSDQSTVWLTQNNSKLGFPTAQCLLDFGFTFGMVLIGSTAGLPAQGAICADPVAPTAPSGATSSYNSQTINTTAGNFTVRVATFNLASGKIRVITDAAADQDCSNNCPVASLSAYTAANNASSGMNGTYFCPAEYPTCAGQSNSFFWKVIDTGTTKTINQNNGLGEQDPGFVFDSFGAAKYFHTWQEYRNSNFSAAAGINSASIIENGQISLNYNKLDSKQQTEKSPRGLLGLKGQTLYLIHVLNATIPDSALVLRSLGLDHAIILDGGGSSAMIYQGQYKTGPGRNIPNAVLIRELP